MGLKVSGSMNKALAHLREFSAEQLKDPQPVNVVEVSEEQFGKLVNDYETVLKDGTERGITLGDFEAVGNFQRDLHTATRVIAGEVGIEYLEKNDDQDSLKLTMKLPEIASHGLTITGAAYRPGVDEETSQDYSAVTRTWGGSEDDKAVDAHLKALLGKKLRPATASK